MSYRYPFHPLLWSGAQRGCVNRWAQLVSNFRMSINGDLYFCRRENQDSWLRSTWYALPTPLKSVFIILGVDSPWEVCYRSRPAIWRLRARYCITGWSAPSLIDSSTRNPIFSSRAFIYYSGAVPNWYSTRGRWTALWIIQDDRNWHKEFYWKSNYEVIPFSDYPIVTIYCRRRANIPMYQNTQHSYFDLGHAGARIVGQNPVSDSYSPLAPRFTIARLAVRHQVHY